MAVSNVVQLPERDAALQRAAGLLTQKKYAEGQAALEQWLHENPKDAGAWCYLGIALRQQGHLAAAVAAARRSAELAPQEPVILSNLGSALRHATREEALEVHARAAALAPGDLDIRFNRAISLNDFGRLEEAVAEFDVALALQPENAKTHVERAATLLQLGRFEEGLAEYEYRRQHREVPAPDYKMPRWEGQDLQGKTLLLWEDQGMGDTILCSRYFAMVKARGARVLANFRAPLHPLLEGFPGIDRLLSPGPVGEPVHYHLPVISLPLMFKTTLDTIPPPPVLCAPPAPVGELARLVSLGKDRFRVGIIWSGSTAFPNNRTRSVEASRFLPLAEIPGVQLYSLQKDAPEKQLLDAGGDGLVIRLGSHLNNFSDTAAVLKQLDLVIMTDSAVAHLAGTLGTPVWNLLSFTPYWLYRKEGENCPWYPSMRLFRQPRLGDWDSVFKSVAPELAKAVAQRR